ncbi:LOW QUALITY PROTEIN: lufaxin-like [Lutzomyia longipalpis]|uniref:LOW QUALITY PROTEIN: lufaxin-like n=1 Tax=Lutzomyia longipalpis TaxID=7200 RepID=UPI002483452F|nr:LOW QUALITY PROTEIN: lufaxin-like [Lutzomyia longipalpis]
MPCESFQHYTCTNNKTHFTVNFEAKNGAACISSIKLFSFPKDKTTKKPTKSTIYCQRGGIGLSYCLLVFKKNEDRRDARVEIYGIPSSKNCLLKERYIGPNPKLIDPYGIPYKFDKKDNWNVERTEISKFTDSKGNSFYCKDGLFNTQITYLAKDDKFSVVRDIVVKDKKKFSLHFSNYKEYRISFLDIYWFQETLNDAAPKFPYIHYNGPCEKKNQTCELIFETKEPITYAFVKVFINIAYNTPRVRGRNSGRG